MPILPPGPGPVPSQQGGGTCSFRASDIITFAMQEIGAIDPNEVPQGPEMANGLVKLNRMIDAWNADGRYVWAYVFNQYTLVPNLQPHTIGPNGATFFTTQRPEKVLEANIILNAGTNNAVRCPMEIRDADWWANKRAYQVVGTLPTNLYYEPDWPNGSLYLWIIPTQNYPIELVTWTLITQFQLSTPFCLPPGYMDAVIYSLAEALCPSYQRPVSPDLQELRRRAVQRIFGPNTASPKISLQDSGMPVGGKQKPYFNWISGLPT